MDILLWRHAEAEDGPDDMARALTKTGREQARAMADWLREHGPKRLRVLVSPALRTRQTAAALTNAVSLCEDLAPDSTAARALAKLAQLGSAPGENSPEAAWLVVGHQPTLGQLAANLVTGRSNNWSVRKGSLWWLKVRERAGQREVVIMAVVQPEHGQPTTRATPAR